MTSGTDNEWDAAGYDDDQSFVYEHGAALVDLLDPAPDERVLDLGCGTGHLTAEIAERGADVVGVDADPDMLGRAHEAHPETEFRRADARDLDFDRAFDAVLSNAMLHWVDAADQDAVLGNVHDALVPGGRLVAELGGVGNVAAIVGAVQDAMADRGHAVENPWHFPTVAEYATRLERAGFEVRLARLFDRPTTLSGETGLADWLAQFGDSLFAPLDAGERDALVREVEDALRGDHFDGEDWTADYRRLRVVAVRP